MNRSDCAEYAGMLAERMKSELRRLPILTVS